MNKLTVFAIGAGLLLISAAAAAEMYRWVDSAGEVQYSDRPTQGSTEVQVRVPGDSPVPTVAEDGSTPADAADSLPEDDATQVRSQLCVQAKKRLNVYEGTDRLYEQGEAGDKRELSTDERVDTILKARRTVKELCNAPTS